MSPGDPQLATAALQAPCKPLKSTSPYWSDFFSFYLTSALHHETTGVSMFLEDVVNQFWNVIKFVVVVQSLSCVQLFVTPWTAACQALLSSTIKLCAFKNESMDSWSWRGPVDAIRIKRWMWGRWKVWEPGSLHSLHCPLHLGMCIARLLFPACWRLRKLQECSWDNKWKST